VNMANISLPRMQGQEAALDAALPDPSNGVCIENLTVRFGTHTVLDDLSLTIKRGEFLTVLGRSGCGKTTLLRFIAGFIKEEGLIGNLTVAGRNLTQVPTHQRNIGLLFQNYALFPHLTVFENVAFGLRARRRPNREIHQRVGDALKMVQLADEASAMPAQLSGGMQQRAALARALVIEPDVLLLDEPLSALDANLCAAVRTELKALHERLPNLTIICVTHDQDDALVLSDRTLLMRDGHIAQLGTPQQLYDTPNDSYVARYLGTANLLAPELVFAQGDARRQIRDRVACLRPEMLRITPPGKGQLQGTVVSVEWYGAVMSLSVALDAEPHDRLQVSVSRAQAQGTIPQKGARVSLSYEAEHVVLIKP